MRDDEGSTPAPGRRRAAGRAPVAIPTRFAQPQRGPARASDLARASAAIDLRGLPHAHTHG
ncbi:hypothetical protein GCM10027033_02150 [Leucobacter ruminantium]